MDTIISSVKYLTVFLCCFYAFTKLACIKLKPADVIFIPYGAGASVALSYLPQSAKLAVPVCMFIFCALYFFARFRLKFTDTLCLGVIAMGATAFIMVISFFVSLVVMLAFYFVPNENARNLSAQCVLSAAQIAAVIFLFRTERLKGGVINLKGDGTYERLIFAGLICILAMTMMYSKQSESDVILQLCIAFIAVCGVSFVIWWRKLVTSDYREQVRSRNVKILQDNLTLAEQERQQLKRENAELAKIIHRDNKIIPAMQIAVKNIGDRHADEAAPLEEELEKLLSERAAAVDGLCGDGLETTGVLLIDAAVEFLESSAKKRGVGFEFETDRSAVEALRATFTEPIALNTLLCDLGENAEIAAAQTAGGRVKIQFRTGADGFARVEFYDNGAPFDARTFREMGLRRFTTHENDGGSGIGLVTAFEICAKYSASFEIDEAPVGEFTKRVTICADGKAERRVRTGRNEAVKACLTRSDVKIF